ncbi:Coenzyme F420 hydrogenase/dehydrogenase, beta subunit C-terminal domain [Marinobacter lipolyticus]|uniref:Coenzyme F420 hydrogenase/dehydrogenase, beta subunit C-terminal domain n=1 Tax=Marinobacter lipolyticus TaxID=209639 RepID=UPI003A8F853C
MRRLGGPVGLSPVLDGGYCVGCGACAVASEGVRIDESWTGLYKAKVIARSGEKASAVCPFASDLNENGLGRKLYGDTANHDARVGYYQDIYAGHVSESEFRKNGSSGGMVTWVLARLFDLGEIDGVIHVGETATPGELFQYRISENKADILSNSKSRYYPVHMDEVLREIRGNGKKYAFVGVPCFVKAVRLLAEHDAQLADSIRYCIAIFCGHFKTKGFAEMIAWQQGIAPSRLSGINFRVKYTDRPANQYGVQVLSEGEEGAELRPPMMTRNLYGMDWGLGYFKPKACDWCDDIAGETGDLACGDAWLPEFSGDSKGTNIVVIRNEFISSLVSQGIENGELMLSEQSVEKVYESQAGNYRHRQEGLSVRIADANRKGVWCPTKRIDASSFCVSAERAKMYRLREEIAEKSHSAFYKAKKGSGFIQFYFSMLPLEIRYYMVNKRLVKGMGKSVLAIAHYLHRRFFSSAHVKHSRSGNIS